MSPLARLTERDVDVLAALERGPHTASQLLRLSETFSTPFAVERLLRRRLQQLSSAALVRRFAYTGLAGRGGAPNGYLLTPLGRRVLHGPDALAPSKRFGSPPAMIRHRHTHALADALVHLFACAHRQGVNVTGFYREGSVRLQDGGDAAYPDAAFQIARGDGKTFSYLVELDCGTERIASLKDDDSWARKLRIYEAARTTGRTAFRVLVLTLSSSVRASHILDLARTAAQNPHRGLVYAATLPAFLSMPHALTEPLFRDPAGRAVAVLPS